MSDKYLLAIVALIILSIIIILYVRISSKLASSSERVASPVDSTDDSRSYDNVMSSNPTASPLGFTPISNQNPTSNSISSSNIPPNLNPSDFTLLD